MDMHLALAQLNKETQCQYSLSGDRMSGLVWLSPDIPKPNYKALIAAYDRYQNDYVRMRRKEYPAVEDQLDMLYRDMKNGTTTWVQLIDGIKTRHPKGVSQ